MQRGLIRVDADELTYPLHILLRYELEKKLLSGELAVRDLPEAWNAGMEQRLGVRPANDSDGCLQDIHWAVGSFGYFPSYALGAVIAAQLYESLRADVPALDEQIARGEFSRPVRLAARARARPRRQGARAGAAASSATGKPLSAAAFMRYLEAKYLESDAPASSAARLTPRRANRRREPSRTLARLQAQLRGSVGKAIADFGMIAAGDRVMVCLSGGKDSYTLLDILLSLQRSAPVDFELLAVNLDQKQPGFPAARAAGVPALASACPSTSSSRTPTASSSASFPEGRTMCGLCSRLRRGALYRFAAENGITKIALGHHRDDIVETLFLNLFFGGRLKAMAPKLLSEDGRHIVIRPLAYVAERDIARYARGRGFPDHSLHAVRLAGEPAARRHQEDARRLGARAIPAAPRPSSPPCATWSRSTWPMRAASTSPDSTQQRRAGDATAPRAGPRASRR